MTTPDDGEEDPPRGLASGGEWRVHEEGRREREFAERERPDSEPDRERPDERQRDDE